MKINNLGADLHIHTVASDGINTPEEVVEMAHRAGLKAIAITDHDTVAGVEAAVKAAKSYGIEVIPGAEFTTSYVPVAHILGLGIDVHECRLTEHFRRLDKNRLYLLSKAFRAMKSAKVTVGMQEIKKEMGTITILNLKNYLLYKHVNKDGDERDCILQDIIDEWIDATPSPKECIDIIHSCGGKAILAHPTMLFEDKKAIKKVISDFSNLGLDGIEVNHVTYKDSDRLFLNKCADEMGLLRSGGSDFHGISGREKLASSDPNDDMYVPYEYWEEIRRKNSGG